jgi:hypothetical protein
MDGRSMTTGARLIAVLAFVLAFASQPLALDACAISCEAARAARGPVVAAPCHHSSSCATQTTQPTTPGSMVTSPAVLPALVVSAVEFRVVGVARSLSHHPPQTLSPPLIPIRV